MSCQYRAVKQQQIIQDNIGVNQGKSGREQAVR